MRGNSSTQEKTNLRQAQVGRKIGHTKKVILSADPKDHDHSQYLDYDYLEDAARNMEIRVTPQVILAGDVHGDLNQIQYLAGRAKREGAGVILQVGDLGYWPHTDPDYIKKADKILERAGVHIIAIDGNHENFKALNSPHPMHENWQVLGRRVLYAPRGTTWEWFGKKILALGGAHSTDVMHRRLQEKKERKDYKRQNWRWWEEEDIMNKDIEKAKQAGQVDILITHDCPESVHIPNDVRAEDPETQENRKKLQQVLNEVKPKLVVHGHYHTRYSSVGGHFNYASRVEGLGRDGQKEDSALTINLQEKIKDPEF